MSTKKCRSISAEPPSETKKHGGMTKKHGNEKRRSARDEGRGRGRAGTHKMLSKLRPISERVRI